jgi:hypothetical protein
MSDDTLNAGSAEELPAEESTGVTGELAAEEATTGESTEQAEPKGKEKALRDTEAALKERQADYTRLSQQYAELKGNMDMLVKMQSQVKPAVEEKDWLETVDEDKILENPGMVKDLMKQMRREFAAVMQDRDAWMREEIAKARGSTVDPALKAVVEQLKSDPELGDLPEGKLLAMARRMGTAGKQTAVMQPRGNIAGGQRGQPQKAVAKDGEFTAEQLAWLRASGAMKDGKRDDTLE